MKSKGIGAKDSFSMGCACQAAAWSWETEMSQPTNGVWHRSTSKNPSTISSGKRLHVGLQTMFFLRFPSNSQSPALFKGYHGGHWHRPIRRRWFSSSWVLWPSWRSWTRTKARWMVWGWCETHRFDPRRKRTPWNFRTWNGDFGPEMEVKKA